MTVELPYTLKGRYRSIAIAWTVIVIPPTFLNLGLIYGLWYGTDLDRVLVLTLIPVLTIPTTLLGIGTAVSITERLLKLCARPPTYRPLGSPRFALDPFMWGYFLALVMISSEITSSLSLRISGHDPPHLSLLALPAPSLLLLLGSLLALSLVLNGLDVKAPVRLGSTARGEGEVRPAVFYVVEDVVAVEGAGGVEWREKWNERYVDSAMFRDMIYWVSVVWMGVFYVLGGGLVVMIWVLRTRGEKAQMMALGVSWAAPFVVGGLLAWWTVWYVRVCLRRERKEGYSTTVDGERQPLLNS